MRCFSSGWLIVALSMQSVAHGASLETYAKLPLYEHVALSPQGDRAAFVTTIGEQREVVVQNLGDTQGVIRLKAGAQKLRDVSWAGSAQLLITVSQSPGYLGPDQSENFALQSFDLQRKLVSDPMMWATQTWNLIATDPAIRVIDGKALLFIHGFTTPRMGDYYAIPSLYKTDLRERTTQLIDAAPVSNTSHYRWVVDSSGKKLLQSIYDEEARRWSLFNWQKERWVEVYSEKSLIDSPFIVGLFKDDNTVLIKRRELGAWVVRQFLVAEGRWGDSIEERCCGTNFIRHPATHKVIGMSWLDLRKHYNFFDGDLQKRWDQVVQSFPGEEVTLESWSDDLNRMVVKVFGKKTGAAYMLVDLEMQTVSRMGNLYAGIAADDVATVKPITYSASDGSQIGAYLTLPVGKNARNLPLVVLPHGGPESRDTLEFDWLPQALASQGYLVLQPNFRGSWGIGQSLEQAGYGEFGRKMQTDLSDGVRALVKLGVVDPSRVCIVGASYGGYAALAGAAFEPDVYRCAVSIAGLSDLAVHLKKYVDPKLSGDTRSLRYMLRYLGANSIKDPLVAERSPANFARAIRSPVLLVHGENDAVVSIAQSQIMSKALKAEGRTYEFVKLKSEDHWLSRSDTRLEALQAVIKFLQAHNPP